MHVDHSTVNGSSQCICYVRYFPLTAVLNVSVYVRYFHLTAVLYVSVYVCYVRYFPLTAVLYVLCEIFPSHCSAICVCYVRYFPLTAVLYGYPPKEISSYDPTTSLSELSLTSGQTLIVSELSQVRQQDSTQTTPRLTDTGMRMTTHALNGSHH